MHPASKWDSVSGQVPHSQQVLQPPLQQQEEHRQAFSEEGGAGNQDAEVDVKAVNNEAKSEDPAAEMVVQQDYSLVTSNINEEASVTQP